MNETIRTETKGIVMKLIGVNLNSLSEQTRTEIRHIIGEHGANAAEMIDQANVMTIEDRRNQKQIVPSTILNTNAV